MTKHKFDALITYLYQSVRGAYPETVKKAELIRKATNEMGYDAENAGRRLRDLEKEGAIEKTYYKNLAGIKCVQYAWIPPKIKPREEVEKELIIATGL